MEEQMISLENFFEEMRNANIMHSVDKIAILRSLKEKFGDEVYEIAAKAIGENAKKHFQNLPIPIEERTIEKLIEVLWEPMTKIGMEYSKEQTSTGVQMKCTKCPLVDLFQFLNATDVGFALHCTTDASIVDGFNPKIGFKRELTLVFSLNSLTTFFILHCFFSFLHSSLILSTALPGMLFSSRKS